VVEVGVDVIKNMQDSISSDIETLDGDTKKLKEKDLSEKNKTTLLKRINTRIKNVTDNIKANIEALKKIPSERGKWINFLDNVVVRLNNMAMTDLADYGQWYPTSGGARFQWTMLIAWVTEIYRQFRFGYSKNTPIENNTEFDKMMSDIVTKNSKLEDIPRLKTAETLLWTEEWELVNKEGEFTEKWQAILDSHNQDWVVFNLNFSQIRARVEILQNAWFTSDQIRVLMENGICWNVALEVDVISGYSLWDNVNIPRSDWSTSEAVITEYNELVWKYKTEREENWVFMHKFLTEEELDRFNLLDISEGVIESELVESFYDIWDRVNIPRSDWSISEGIITWHNELSWEYKVEREENWSYAHKFIGSERLNEVNLNPVDKIGDVKSFWDLYLILWKINTLEWSRKSYSGADLINMIQRVESWELDINFVTRTWGLRDKVQLLLNNKKFLLDQWYLSTLWPKGLSEHVSQWSVWNCYFVAALYAMKSSSIGVELMSDMIKPSLDWRWRDVRFFKENWEAWTTTIKESDLVKDKQLSNWQLGDYIIERAYSRFEHEMRWFDPGKTYIRTNENELSFEGGRTEKSFSYFFWPYARSSLFYLGMIDVKQELSDIQSKENVVSWVNSLHKSYLLNIFDQDPSFIEESLGIRTREDLQEFVENDSGRSDSYKYYVKDVNWRKQELYFSHAYILGEIDLNRWVVEVVNPHDTNAKRIYISIDNLSKCFSTISSAEIDLSWNIEDIPEAEVLWSE